MQCDAMARDVSDWLASHKSWEAYTKILEFYSILLKVEICDCFKKLTDAVMRVYRIPFCDIISCLMGFFCHMTTEKWLPCMLVTPHVG